MADADLNFDEIDWVKSDPNTTANKLQAVLNDVQLADKYKIGNNSFIHIQLIGGSVNKNGCMVGEHYHTSLGFGARKYEEDVLHAIYKYNKKKIEGKIKIEGWRTTQIFELELAEKNELEHEHSLRMKASAERDIIQTEFDDFKNSTRERIAYYEKKIGTLEEKLGESEVEAKHFQKLYGELKSSIR